MRNSIIALASLGLLSACGVGDGGGGGGKPIVIDKKRIPGEYCYMSRDGGTWSFDFRGDGKIIFNREKDRVLTALADGNEIETFENDHGFWDFEYRASDDALLSWQFTSYGNEVFKKETCGTSEFKKTFADNVKAEAQAKKEHEARVEAARIEAERPPPPLVMPVRWRPKEWDTRAHPMGRSEATGDKKQLQASRQALIQKLPTYFYFMGNDTLLDENMQPIWIWWAAIKDCKKAEQIVTDLTTEFGDRERGSAELKAAYDGFKAWAKTQPNEATIYFKATLSDWNQNTGAFNYGDTSPAVLHDPSKLELPGRSDSLKGASVSIASYGAEANSLSSIMAHSTRIDCSTEDGKSYFEHQPNVTWVLRFGTPKAGWGNSASFSNAPKLPLVTMDRETAATFAQGNATREVQVAVTVAIGEGSWTSNNGRTMDRPGVLKAAVVTDPAGKVLAKAEYN